MPKTDEVALSQFLETCDIQADEYRVEAFTMVILGGDGDLSRRKILPSLYHLFIGNEFPKEFSILGFDMADITEEEYRSKMKDAVQEFSNEYPDRWDEFSSHLFYLHGNFEDEEVFKKLILKVTKISVPGKNKGKEVIYYMAVPPQIMPRAVDQLKHHNLCRGIFSTKIVVEKPFGRDRASAAELNRMLLESFDEDQIYRIDHYLSKEPVQNIIFMRFSNTIFEEFWNYRYVDNVQITVAEDIGIEHRGSFYEKAGVVRDIVQNHMMQMLGLVAMEPPVGFRADFIRDEKIKIFRSIRPMDDEHIDNFVVRGQYGQGRVNGEEVVGYRDEKNVSDSSLTPTFFAAKLFIDNWRWAGVPFYIRTGKRLEKRVTEICIEMKQLPLRLFGRSCDTAGDANLLTLTVQPDEKIALKFGVKYPYSHNQIYPVHMVFGYKDTFKVKSRYPYERLLVDCIKGDLTLFLRQDAVEAMWQVVDPIIARWENIPPAGFPNYKAGTWGPEEALTMIQRDGRKWITH
jgi:glucose-6-phosphate 1-dehydrogenase